MLQKLGSSINHNQLTRLPLTTFISTNTNCTVDHSKKPFFPLLLYKWNCKNHFVSFHTVDYKICYFPLLGVERGGGGRGGSKFILKNGKGERENGNRTENGGS